MMKAFLMERTILPKKCDYGEGYQQLFRIVWRYLWTIPKVLYFVASGGGREVQNTGTNNQGNEYTAYTDGAYAYRNHAPAGK